MSSSRLVPFLVLAAVTLAGTVRAATLNLDTGKSVSLAQGGTDTLTFSFTNSGTTLTDDFLGWVLGIQVLPAGGNTGSVTLGTLSQPAVNPMPVGAFDSIQPTPATFAGGASINGTTSFVQIGLQATAVGGTVLTATSYNMGDLAITASGDASGVWNVYAVQQGGANFQSYWTDVGTATETDFANLPRTAGDSSLLVGTVEVTAVPEPGTAVLGAVAGLLVAGWCVRQKRARRERR